MRPIRRKSPDLANLGCPRNVASLGQKRDLVKEFWGSGSVGGLVKSGVPRRGKAEMETQISSSSRRSSSSFLLTLILCSTLSRSRSRSRRNSQC